ncbi:MAG: Mur ligase domain-containing protein [Desulfovibrio sp.]|jgi:UDP-N-acetylmuramoyl-tripeptide--D-alanyl-D-alanine ligase|nr:Mur ligase domain-containing protein [Desulfovibrio sp.]
MRLNLGEMATALGCGPERILPDARSVSVSGEGADWAGRTFTGASADSRQVVAGDIFFCLKGERADGHDFALAAASAGACAIVAVRDPFPAEARDAASGPALPPVFLTDNVGDALRRLAARHRAGASAKVIGLTGTAGKTTVKEILAGVLAERGRTERNRMNLNNGIGMPLSMLNASPDALYWVMEAGVSRTGDMEELAPVLRPDTALILNVGVGHAEGLGKGAAAEKARLLDFVLPGGTALVSADYPELDRECSVRSAGFAARGMCCLRFSARDGEFFCHALYIGPAEKFGPSDPCYPPEKSGREVPPVRGMYAVRAAGAEFECEAPFRGAYGAENVAAVAAVALSLGLEPSEIRRGLASAETPAQRFAPHSFFVPGRGRYTIIDDSYNSNPLSAGRMIRAAGDMARESGLPFVPVLGEMLELGDESPAAHENLGEIAASAHPAAVFWTGGQADRVRRGLIRGGYAGIFEELPARAEDFVPRLEAMGPALVLFKGSRANRLERWIAAPAFKAAEDTQYTPADKGADHVL